MVTKYETWVDEVNCKCRFYLDWRSNSDGSMYIKDIYVSVTTVIGAMLKSPVWDKLQNIYGKDWAGAVTEIGTQTHILMEHYVNKDIDAFRQAEIDMRYKLKNQDHINKVYDKLSCLIQSEYAKPSENYLTEKMLLSQDPAIKIAGTADLIDIDRNILRDWKSGVYTELTLHHKLQLSAYVVMAVQMWLLEGDKDLISGVTCTTNPQNKFFKCTELDMPQTEIKEHYNRFVQLYNDLNWSKVIDTVFNKPNYGSVDVFAGHLERKKCGRITLRQHLENERNFTDVTLQYEDGNKFFTQQPIFGGI